MKSYNNDPKVKAEAVQKIRLHKEAETLVQNTYRDELGRGCWINCLSGNGNDVDYLSEQYGIPELITRLIECFFEELPTDEARVFAVEAMEAIPVGVDLLNAWAPYAHWLMGALLEANPKMLENTKKAVQGVQELYVAGWPEKDAAKAASAAAWEAWEVSEANYTGWAAKAAAHVAKVVWEAAREAAREAEVAVAMAVSSADVADVFYPQQAAKFIEIVKSLK
jgi:hypothetical protein